MKPSGQEDQRFGFLIDNRKCIGCHACSTACKSENEVPLGVNRTWVKSVETGLFPNVTRHFQVTRCNHCENPPCVSICPVTAMYQRDDGIVEFDGDVCIGCKACIQACPYDAVHVDPSTGTAAKCHYCAHRTDIGLEPACVVVCPEHAILAGDLNDPSAEISQVLARERVSVRKPEQGTAPKLFYIEGESVSLNPQALEPDPSGFLFAEQVSDQLVMSEGKPALQMAQVAFNAQHEIPWHWPVPAYLVTKAVATGLPLALGLAWLFLKVPFQGDVAVWSGATALGFLGLTGAFLVIDLERPERFLSILLRPQWRSWLARGAYIIMAQSLLLSAWFCLEVFAAPATADGWRFLLLALLMPASLMTAIYTAFLFAQAEGRDLWQTGLAPFHLGLQALVMGASSLLVLGLFIDLEPALRSFAGWLLGLSLLADLFITLVGEFGTKHASSVASAAARLITHGPYKNIFWGGAVTLGHLLPLALLMVSCEGGYGAAAGLMAGLGLYAFEYVWVMAPQRIPNS